MKRFLAAHQREILDAVMNARVGDMIEIKPHSIKGKTYARVGLIVMGAGQYEPAGARHGQAISAWEADAK